MEATKNSPEARSVIGSIGAEEKHGIGQVERPASCGVVASFV